MGSLQADKEVRPLLGGVVLHARCGLLREAGTCSHHRHRPLAFRLYWCFWWI
jgi:Fe-S-cluster containining protein